MASPSGKGKKHGRDKVKCELYKKRHVREFNKSVRIARSNGYDKAIAYAIPFGISGEVRKRISKFSFGRKKD